MKGKLGKMVLNGVINKKQWVCIDEIKIIKQNKRLSKYVEGV